MLNRRRLRLLVILVVLALGAGSAFAGQGGPKALVFGIARQSSGAPQGTSAPVPKAFSNLFQPGSDIVVDVVASKPVTEPRQKTRVVCGLTVIQADPSIDPKFVRKSPDRGVKFTMRTIEPPICK